LAELTGDGVKYYESMELSWEATVGGNNNIELGNSDNEMYVSLEKPTFAPVVSEVHIAVLYATTANSESQVIEMLMCYFGAREVKRKGDPLSLQYYGNRPGATGKLGLIARGNADCTAWAALFVGVLGCHGISAKQVRLRSTAVIARNDKGEPSTWEIMQIKKYGLDGYPAANAPYPYELTRIGKLPGQGNTEPRVDTFSNHAIVEIDENLFFDPSYGIPYRTNRAGIINNQFIEKSVSAFGRGTRSYPGGPIWQDVVHPARYPRNDGTEIEFIN